LCAEIFTVVLFMSTSALRETSISAPYRDQLESQAALPDRSVT